ncbi:MAG: M1 family metallopeptidase [Kofleriaceae bacterium]
MSCPARALLVAWCGGLVAACHPPAGPAMSPAVTPAPAAATPAAPPRLDGPRLPAGVAPQRYRLRLALAPGLDRFDGEVEIDLTITAPTTVVWLHADALAIDAATVRIGAATVPATLVADPDHQRVGLALAAALAPGSATAILRYRGQVVDDEAMGLFRQQAAGAAYLFSQGEGVFARRVVPCFDEPAFKVPWSVTVTAPAELDVYANMPMVERTVTGATATVRFADTPSMPSYLLALTVGRFDVVEVGPVGRAGVPARILAPRGDGPRTTGAAAALPGLVDALERYFDRPLPLAKLDVVVVPTLFGAMENLGLITFARSVLLDQPGQSSTAATARARSVLAHELAHQWFGNLVTPAWWDDLWLSESFATWMAAELTAATDPEVDHLGAQRDQLERAMAADALATARPLRRPIRGDLDVDDAFDAIAYEKGAAILAMFERRLGAAPFRDGVRRYLAAHADGTATSGDFVAALAATEPAAGAALASFLDHPGVPTVELALTCDPTPAVRVTLDGAGAAAPWTLPVCVRFPDRDGRWGERCAWVPPAGAQLELPSCPAWLSGNAAGAGYYRVRYADGLDAALRAHLREVAVAERAARADELAAQVRDGTAPVAAIPPWIDALLATGDRSDLRAATRLATVIDAHVGPGDAPRWQAWVRGRFDAALARLGLTDRPGDSPATRAARAAVIEVAVIAGRDRRRAATAAALVDGWLAGTTDLGDERRPLLAVAGALGPDALRARLAQLAATTDDRGLQGELLDALAGRHDAAARAAHQALFRDGRLDPTAALAVLTAGLGTDDDAATWAELTASYDLIAARLPSLDAAAVVEASAARCSATAAAEVEAFFAPRAATAPLLALALPPALAEIRQCAAERARLAPAITALLAR